MKEIVETHISKNEKKQRNLTKLDKAEACILGIRAAELFAHKIIKETKSIK